MNKRLSELEVKAGELSPAERERRQRASAPTLRDLAVAMPTAGSPKEVISATVSHQSNMVAQARN